MIANWLLCRAMSSEKNIKYSHKILRWNIANSYKNIIMTYLLDSGRRNFAMNRWWLIYETTLVFATSNSVFLRCHWCPQGLQVMQIMQTLCMTKNMITVSRHHWCLQGLQIMQTCAWLKTVSRHHWHLWGLQIMQTKSPDAEALSKHDGRIIFVDADK